MITHDKLAKWFEYNPPTGGKVKAARVVYEAGHRFAMAVLANTDASADQSSAIRKIREAAMTAVEAMDD